MDKSQLYSESEESEPTTTADDDFLEDILDFQGVMKRVCGNIEFLQLLLVIFREDCGRNCDTIRTALEDQDAAAVAAAAHKLKGVVGNLGSRKALRYIRQVENFSRGGKLHAVTPIFAEFEESLAEFTTTIERIVRDPQLLTTVGD